MPFAISPPTDRSLEPASASKGAEIGVDARAVRRVLAGLLMGALVVTSVALTVAGLQHDAQVGELRQHGVPVAVTVTGCTGLLGGSGSNAAGYACRGVYEVGGRTYRQALPGSTFHPPGARLEEITVRREPTLLSPPGSVADDSSSWERFLLPAALFLTAVVLAADLIRRRRVRRTGEPT